MGLALAGLSAFGLETGQPAAAPIAFSQEAPTPPIPTLAITATAQPSFTPSAVPTATAIASTATSLPRVRRRASRPARCLPRRSQLRIIRYPPPPQARGRPPPRFRCQIASRRLPHQLARRSAPHIGPPVPAKIPGVNIAADIPYVVRPGADPRQTSLDVYIPAAAAGLPVLMYVHGGGWSSGDKDAVGAKAAYFTAHGFVFVSINYRLIPAAWPAQQAADVAQAVAWVKENIGGYGGDRARLFVLGHSAGAHLTALIASDETYLREAGLGPGALRGVILLDSAAYDVEQLMRSPEGKTEPFRPAFGDDPAQWPRVSPRAKIGPGKSIPPHLLLLSTGSGQRRPAAESLAGALRGWESTLTSPTPAAFATTPRSTKISDAPATRRQQQYRLSSTCCCAAQRWGTAAPRPLSRGTESLSSSPMIARTGHARRTADTPARVAPNMPIRDGRD